MTKAAKKKVAKAVPTTMTRGEIAELFGVDVRTVFNWNTSGWMVRSGSNYDVAKSVSSVTRQLITAAAGRSSDATLVKDNVEHRGRLALAQARAVELRNAATEGTLLPAVEVEARWSQILAAVRAGCLAMPARVGARLPHLTAHDISEVDHEVRRALTELADNDGVKNG